MTLETASGLLVAASLTPISFVGELAVRGRLPHGSIRNLNVIFRPERIEAEVQVRTGPTEIVPAAASDVIFMVSGDARVGKRMLSPLTTLIDPGEPIALRPGAQALHITLVRKSS